MARLATIIYTKDDYLVFYSAGEFVTRGRSPQHFALATNLIKNAESVEVAEDNLLGGNKILTVKGQKNG